MGTPEKPEGYSSWIDYAIDNAYLEGTMDSCEWQAARDELLDVQMRLWKLGDTILGKNWGDTPPRFQP